MKKDLRFKKHSYIPEQVRGHLQGARKKLKAAKKIALDDEEASYQLAYEAMLKASLALILRNGLRPRSQPGHHVAIIEKAGQLLGKQYADHVRIFDEMRRNRNSFLVWSLGSVGSFF
jgi:uncharacterized protein (UPF0332 family)